MLKMISEMGIYLVGAALLLYLVYALFFSGKAKVATEERRHRRLERRENERRLNPGTPPEGEERRKDPRRSRDGS